MESMLTHEVNAARRSETPRRFMCHGNENREERREGQSEEEREEERESLMV